MTSVESGARDRYFERSNAFATGEIPPSSSNASSSTATSTAHTHSHAMDDFAAGSEPTTQTTAGSSADQNGSPLPAPEAREQDDKRVVGQIDHSRLLEQVQAAKVGCAACCSSFGSG